MAPLTDDQVTAPTGPAQSVMADTQTARARARRAMDHVLLTLAANQTMTTITLTSAGRGVAHNPACAPRPIRSVRWSDQARESLDAKRITGFEPPEPPEPEGSLTYAQYLAPDPSK